MIYNAGLQVMRKLKENVIYTVHYISFAMFKVLEKKVC